MGLHAAVEIFREGVRAFADHVGDRFADRRQFMQALAEHPAAADFLLWRCSLIQSQARGAAQLAGGAVVAAGGDVGKRSTGVVVHEQVTDDDAGGKIAEHRAKSEAAENGRCHHGSTEKEERLGEERFAGPIARALIARRDEGHPIRTTAELSAVVARAVKTREPGQDPATRTFQALRIHLNQELEELSLVLPQCVDLLNPGGRLAVISFHSLEDRLVKQFMRRHAKGEPVPRGIPLTQAQLAQRTDLILIGKAIMPSEQELQDNPRARSAVLRIAEKQRHG